MPGPRSSRAVLIGTSAYDSPDFKPLLAVRNNLEVLQELLTRTAGRSRPAGAPSFRIRQTRGACAATIRDAAREASAGRRRHALKR